MAKKECFLILSFLPGTQRGIFGSNPDSITYLWHHLFSIILAKLSEWLKCKKPRFFDIPPPKYNITPQIQPDFDRDHCFLSHFYIGLLTPLGLVHICVYVPGLYPNNKKQTRPITITTGSGKYCKVLSSSAKLWGKQNLHRKISFDSEWTRLL